MKVEVIKPFAYAFNGYDVRHYQVGIQNLTKECADLALAEKWAVKMPRQKKLKKPNKRAGE